MELRFDVRLICVNVYDDARRLRSQEVFVEQRAVFAALLKTLREQCVCMSVLHGMFLRLIGEYIVPRRLEHCATMRSATKVCFTACFGRELRLCK